VSHGGYDWTAPRTARFLPTLDLWIWKLDPNFPDEKQINTVQHDKKGHLREVNEVNLYLISQVIEHKCWSLVSYFTLKIIIFKEVRRIILKEIENTRMFARIACLIAFLASVAAFAPAGKF